MAVSGIGSNTATSSPSVVTLSGGAAIGDTVIAAVYRGGNATVPTVADSKGNTYTRISPPSIIAPGSTTVFLFRSVLTTALVATDTVTATSASANLLPMAVVKMTDAPHASAPVGVPSWFFTSDVAGLGNVWRHWMGRQWYTDTTLIVAQAVAANRTDTPNTNWNEIYDYSVSAGTRGFTVIYRELTTDIGDDPNAGGTWNGTGGTQHGAGIALRRSSATVITPTPQRVFDLPTYDLGKLSSDIEVGQFWPKAA